MDMSNPYSNFEEAALVLRRARAILTHAALLAGELARLRSVETSDGGQGA